MYIIGLTGGIGSGKSEAAKQFLRLGAPVVDLDIIAHSLTAAGEPMLNNIADIFGEDFLNAEGALNRAKLRTHIFNDSLERKKLEELLHPAIRARAISQLEDNQSRLNPDYQILVVPLLFESDSYQPVVNKTLVIDCDEETQIRRTISRSQLSEAEVKAIIGAQVSRATRRERADEIIENNGSIEELIENVNKIHKKFIKTCIVSK
jgi:dephospho-CoA kinase